MGHSPQASATTFPHVSLITNVMIVLRRTLYSVVSDGLVFLPFLSIAASRFDRISQGASISLEAGFGLIFFLSAVLVVFHSRYQSTLIPLSPSISPS